MGVVAGILLGIQSILDIGFGKIPTKISCLAGAVGLWISISQGRQWQEMLLALLPGLSLLLWAWISKEGIGYGDGILLLALGFLYSLERILLLCGVAFGFCGVVALILMVGFGKKKSHELPFVPFLFLGWIVEGLG